MNAVDTNVLVRFLLRDDEAQAQRAFAVLTQTKVLVTLTVLLETEWVLRGAYRLSKAAIARHLRDIVGLPTVTLAEPSRVASALTYFEAGLDFADALHLAQAQECEGFLTFDRAFVRDANRLQSVVVSEPQRFRATLAI